MSEFQGDGIEDDESDHDMGVVASVYHDESKDQMNEEV